MSKPKQTLPQPLYLTVPEVMVLLGLGRTKVYELIRKEGLPVHKFGRATRIPVDKFYRWLERRAPQVA